MATVIHVADVLGGVDGAFTCVLDFLLDPDSWMCVPCLDFINLLSVQEEPMNLG